MESFYKLKSTNTRGQEIDFSAFKGKVVLIVNTATKCGLAPQFEGLEELYQKYKDDGLVVLGFPSNQFAGQEPVKDDKMEEVCQVNFGVTFPIMKKVDVNGKNADPVFKFLKNELGGILFDAIKWNFTKFLIDKNGKPFKRYSPYTKPAVLEDDIKELLSK